MVGFNRRYARLALALRDEFVSRAQPMSLVYRVNVGYRPPEHWLHHPQEGGGVVLGEACHQIDFCCWLIGAAVTDIGVQPLGGTGAGYQREDNFQITLRFADGSLATILYLSNGSKVFPTETVEISCDNRSARLIDFRRLETARGQRRRVRRIWTGSAKGIAEQVAAFVEAAANPSRFDSTSYFTSSRLALRIDRLLREQLKQLPYRS